MNNENTKTCYECGNNVAIENGVQWGSYFYCESCFKELKCKVDSYHSPSIPTRFKSVSDEDTKLYMGIELETTKNTGGYFYQSDHQEDILYIRRNYKDLDLNFETDSSIGNGKEIITQPMTMKYIYSKEDALKDIFNYLTSKGNYSHDKGRCGLHIHVSKDALGDTEEDIQKTIEKLMLFIETYRDKIEKFSRRKHKQFSHYNAYTIPTHIENVGNESCFNDTNYYKSGKLLYELNKYDAIGHSSVLNTNTSTEKTIEFRMFRGTLRFETFMATIEFVYNLVNVCKENMPSKINWSKVINYGKTKYLKEYNDSLDLIDDNIYLRDYTTQIEDIINKNNETKEKQLSDYKKILNDIGLALQSIVNEPIDFSQDNKIIRDTISFRDSIFNTLSNVLIDDIDANEKSLYVRLKTMGTDYTNTCKTNLKSIKRTLGTYTMYRLSDTTKQHASEILNLLDTTINNMTTSTNSEC